jgi:hypothetical protein
MGKWGKRNCDTKPVEKNYGVDFGVIFLYRSFATAM